MQTGCHVGQKAFPPTSIMRERSGGFMPNLLGDDFAAGCGAGEAMGSGEETALRNAAVYATLCSITESAG
jgi:hypothetical protein